jgi:hypothetical protein
VSFSSEAINHVISGSQDLNVGKRFLCDRCERDDVDASRLAFRGGCYPRRVEAEVVLVCQGVAQRRAHLPLLFC